LTGFTEVLRCRKFRFSDDVVVRIVETLTFEIPDFVRCRGVITDYAASCRLRCKFSVTSLFRYEVMNDTSEGFESRELIRIDSLVKPELIRDLTADCIAGEKVPNVSSCNNCFSPERFRHISVKQHCTDRLVERSIDSLGFPIRLRCIGCSRFVSDTERLQKWCKRSSIFAAAVCPKPFNFPSSLSFECYDETSEIFLNSQGQLVGNRVDRNVVTEVVEESQRILGVTFGEWKWPAEVRMNQIANFFCRGRGSLERVSVLLCLNTGLAIGCIVRRLDEREVPKG